MVKKNMDAVLKSIPPHYRLPSEMWENGLLTSMRFDISLWPAGMPYYLGCAVKYVYRGWHRKIDLYKAINCIRLHVLTGEMRSKGVPLPDYLTEMVRDLSVLGELKNGNPLDQDQMWVLAALTRMHGNTPLLVTRALEVRISTLEADSHSGNKAEKTAEDGGTKTDSQNHTTPGTREEIEKANALVRDRLTRGAAASFADEVLATVMHGIGVAGVGTEKATKIKSAIRNRLLAEWERIKP